MGLLLRKLVSAITQGIDLPVSEFVEARARRVEHVRMGDDIAVVHSHEVLVRAERAQHQPLAVGFRGVLEDDSGAHLEQRDAAHGHDRGNEQIGAPVRHAGHHTPTGTFTCGRWGYNIAAP
jgi:hypothetical protein